MMAAILNSTVLDSDTAILNSDTFLSFLRFTPKHSLSTLTQTNSIWLTWWWLPSWILPCWIQPFCTKLWLKLIQSDSNSFILTQLDDGSQLEFYHVGCRHCHLGFRHLLIFSQIHSKTLSLHSDSWFKLIQSDSNLFILTQLNDGSHLEFCHLEFGHLGFSHLSFSSQTCSHLQDWFPPFAQKRLHSFILTQFDEGSHLEFYHVGLRKLDSFLLTQLDDDSHLEFYHVGLKKLHSFILTQLDDGRHLEFYHVGFRHLVFFSQIHSKTLSLHSDSDSN